MNIVEDIGSTTLERKEGIHDGDLERAKMGPTGGSGQPMQVAKDGGLAMG